MPEQMTTENQFSGSHAGLAPGACLDSLIQQASQGCQQSVDELALLAYDRLYRTANKIVGYQNGTPTLGATALVSEAFARLFKTGYLDSIKDTQHFYSLFARMMRQVLVEYERSKSTQKRGGEVEHVALDVILVYLADQNSSAEELSEAITELEKRYARPAEAIQLKFFGFMTVDEICEQLGVSRSTIESDLRIAKAFIKSYLEDEKEYGKD